MSGHAEAGFSNAKRNLSEDIDDDARNALSKRRRLSFHHLDGGIEQEARIRLRHDEYTIGWICALHIEMAASSAMLDRIHGNIPTKANDSNEYILGSIGPHNIVMACLPSGQYGTNNAATVAGNMLRSFESIRFGLMVGIGGGVPGGDGMPSNIDIRLGDVVVGNKVLQSDLGKIGSDGVFRGTGIPRIPPPSLLNAISKLRTLHEERDSRINSILREMHERHPKLAVEYAYPAGCEDRLFRATYNHNHNPSGDQSKDCSHCNPAELQHRALRTTSEPRIHYGSIASSNQVMKWGPTRDALAKQLDVVCFEMEAAGLMDSFPCIVIRGICDYADSHKSKQWQKYAAATAAAYAKELVSTIAPRSHLKADYSRPQEIASERTQNELRERRRALLKSLRFEQIDARFANIKTAHRNTCEWLLSEDSYLDWLVPSRVAHHHGFLWVSGKPGVGKSTIMKFAMSHAKNMKLSDNDTAIISFFFNARGDALEKSTYGLHRSLLYQLLRVFPDLQTVFDDSSIIPSDQKSCPTINLVQDLFRKAILALGQRHLTCFIDALDECDEKEVRDLIVYFEDLEDEAIENDVWLKICFSSRHYPHIDVRHGLKLVLEVQPGHSQDMETYVQNHLRAGRSPHVESIRAKIIEKAGGIFMWVVLAVEILNNEFVRGNVFRVERRLQEIPTGLSELFRDMLRRDNNNQDELLLCIQWILFSKRPLKREEFYFAILSGLPEGCEAPVLYDSQSVTDEVMNLFVTSCSKGLAEVTRSGLRSVQFIHESVNDFLIKDKGLQELWPGLGNNFENLSHDKLRQCCHTYIASGILDGAKIPDVASMRRSYDIAQKSQGMTFERGRTFQLKLENKIQEAQRAALKQRPFIEYAAKHMLYHANIAAEALPQDDFLGRLSLKDWVQITNLFQKSRRHDYTETATLVYILAAENFVKLLEGHIRRYPWKSHPKGELYGYPLFAALANNHWIAAKTLLGEAAGPFPPEDLFPMVNCRNEFDDDDVFDYHNEFNAFRGQNSTPLHWAISKGQHNKTLARLLIGSGHFNHATRDHEGRSPYHLAAIAGDEATMIMLIEEDIRQQAIRENGSPPLAMETIHNNAINISLLRRSRCISLTDASWRSPLSVAVGNCHEVIVRLLVKWGADINDTLVLNDGSCRESPFPSAPLRPVCLKEALGIYTFLTERGATVNVHGVNERRTLLHQAAEFDDIAMAQVLIDSGADIESGADICNGSDIDSNAGFENGAGLESHTDIENGTDFEDLSDSESDTDFYYRRTTNISTEVKRDYYSGREPKPLHIAAASGHQAMARFLIENGAFVNSLDLYGRTPLHSAAARGQEEMAEFLIESGAIVDFRDRYGGTPLTTAASCGHVGVIETLIDHEAEIESQSRQFGSPLFEAVANGHEDVVKLLIDNGASIYVRGPNDNTTLGEATARGYDAIANILTWESEGRRRYWTTRVRRR